MWEYRKMKTRTILEQQNQFAPMISMGLDFSEIILKRYQSLYPFALCSVGSSVQSIFPPAGYGDYEHNIIEQLQGNIARIQATTTSTACLMVYAVSTLFENGEFKDALIFSISDTDLKNTLTMYPYSLNNGDVVFEMPYTCDFYDH